jgi:hypothetical protein
MRACNVQAQATRAKLDRKEKTMEKKIAELESRLAQALPPDPGREEWFETDGSCGELLEVFERAFDCADSVARDAIKLLKEILKESR